ncbi:unnamed protein product [Heligmosomoides polygyrus]|uniref:EST1_DNA_bind domain-containing protein n=1 Tax=Heligmosomoides polygyrus TaxID=6339 RepID=A0A3P7WHZ6_HELPZ|nr:unnamed protein product [Heligmosomoides polygyrus]
MDVNWFNVMVSVFCGELQCMLAESPRHAAMYNLYLGDLHRYLTNTDQSCLSTLYYRRAVEMDADVGQAFNQLALNETPTNSVRLFLLALLARRPFQKAWDNLKKTFEQKVDGQISSFILSTPFIILVSYSRTSLDSEGIRLVEAIKSLSDPLKDYDLALLLLILSLSCRLALESGNVTYLPRLRNSVSLIMSSRTDYRIILLRCFRSGFNPTEAHQRVVSLMVPESPSTATPKFDVIGGWVLAEVCEWLFHIAPKLHTLRNSKKTPIPAALFNVFHSLVDKLIHQLNRMAKPLRIVDDVDEEIHWLLYGASVADDSRALRQTAHWAFKLCAVDTAPVEYAGYFRRRGPSAETVELQRKMAQLHTENIRREALSSQWMPVYIVLDYDVLIQRLKSVCPLVNSSSLIAVIPSFVLRRLDANKNLCADARPAIRMCEMWQTRGRIRVVEATSHFECCSGLADSVTAAGDVDGQSPTHAMVALLVEDLESFQDMRIPWQPVPAVADYEQTFIEGSETRVVDHRDRPRPKLIRGRNLRDTQTKGP